MEGDGKSPSVKRKGKWSDRFLLDLEQMPAKGKGGAVSALTQETIVQACSIFAMSTREETGERKQQ